MSLRTAVSGRHAARTAAAVAAALALTGSTLAVLPAGEKDDAEKVTVSAKDRLDERASRSVERDSLLPPPADDKPRPAADDLPDPLEVNPDLKPKPKPKKNPKPKPEKAPAAVSASASVDQLKALAKNIVGEAQYPCFANIVQRESTWNPVAVNAQSGAYGLVQALPGSKMASAGADWKTNPATQIKWGLNYMNDRYGSPCDAWAFWQANNWY